MAKLFGFSIDDEEKKSKGVISPVPPNNEDGADYFLSSGFYGQYVDIEGVFRTEFDIIRKYRNMALHPECDTAVEHVVNEAIVADLNDSPVEIDLDNLNASAGLKKVVREEFKYIKDLIGFDKKAHEIFRNWYVDGRLYYHKVIDVQKPELGLEEVRYIDPLKIKLMRIRPKDKANGKTYEVRPSGTVGETVTEDTKVVEFYTYYPQGTAQKYGSIAGKGIKIAKDAITYCSSGLVDRNKHIGLSYLHKSIKALNQLRMIEDSLVIYRISRAPERRIFYIDVGNLPKQKAETYLREVMGRYRNKLVYDAQTGEVRDDRKYMSMMEDFWLPRREGGRGTEITTLPGGQNLGELTDVQYFQTKLYKALNVPAGRMESGTSFDLGRSAEITRDELKFTKFVGKLRKKFSDIFHDTLKTQLILKSVITPEDWDDMKEHIQYDYLKDNHFTELKNLEMMTEKLNVIAQMDPYIGKYFSVEYIRSQILGQTETEIEELDREMADDIKQGRALDPLDVTALDAEKMDAESDDLTMDKELKQAQIKQAKQPSASQNQNGNK